ncbi:diacylglycerol acyltransferase [Neocallimastix lanati (nom. inval.)]|jgi:hypothetical protein|uniref:Diacylglycerol O-acyltransferase n=1 Tax=Neocallimastix californiae TaxID=1754190 RepID=A0A1Y2AN06_9FUNG|nr:diacylglycerol acyltransferase [Neocallimastix sp. JGI-2020a]ORY23953.1 diacylglycerol acyltransferase [Neocallimastix californiae]|eukprot:ORY23953.1 diacylglycerol acyltransferase [Neocallimastix californiae]
MESKDKKNLDDINYDEVAVEKQPTLLETLSAVTWAALMFIGIGLFAILVYFKYTRPLMIIYYIWIIYDNMINKTPVYGRRSEFVRNMKLWKLVRDYFPIRLHKSANLDSDKQYLFGYHPHGIVCISANIIFASEALSISKVFQGLNIRLATIPINFWVPFWRDYILLVGYCDCDRKSITSIFTETKHSAVIVIGGANESLYSFPGTYRIILKRRKGFVKIALKNGISLVPVMNFGEVDVFDQIQHKIVTDNNTLIKKYLGFRLPTFYGRLKCWIPYSKPINVVTGVPIECPKIEKPTEADIQKYLNLYIAELQRIWDENKDKYAKNRKTELELVE